MRKTPAGDNLFRFEEQARQQGYALIAGVDEVGRGPLAGPVVAAAVILPLELPLPAAINDSKKLTAGCRSALDLEIRGLPGIQIGIGQATAAEIDRLNVLNATHLAMRRALENLAVPADFALVDGLPVKGLPVPSMAIVKGDSQSISIAAASIIAKVFRDKLAAEWDREFSGYFFSRHKGYGTRIHLEALTRLGPCPLHRRSFAPVAALLNPQPKHSRQLELNFGPTPDPRPPTPDP